jgi:hypothetical protein
MLEREALSALRSAAQGLQPPPDLTGYRDFSWTFNPPSGYALQIRERLLWSGGTEAAFGRLPEWREAVRVLRAAPLMAAAFEGFGSVFGSTSVTPERVFAGFLSPEALADGHWESAVDKVLEQLIQEELVVEILVPLPGLVAQGRDLQLDDNWVLRVLTSTEVCDLLEAGVLRRPFAGTHVYHPQPPDVMGLVRRWRVPQVRGPEAHKAVGGERFHWDYDQFTRVEPTALLAVLALASGQSVRFPGHAIVQRDFDGKSIRSSIHGTVNDSTPERALTPADEAAWASLWKAHQDTDNKRLRLAVRRFGQAAARIDREEAVLDLFIAAEALYLDASDTTELSFRLALRAAYWHDELEDRAAVNDLMKKGYAARSAIAHGGSPKEWELDRGMQVVAAGLRKALAAGRPPTSDEWSRLILGLPTR